MKWASVFILAITMTLSSAARSATNVPAELFGMHVHGNSMDNVNWPTAPFGTLRLWDTQTSWADINTARGVYEWALLDGYVDWAQSHGVSVLYEICTTPTWASAFKDDLCPRQDNVPAHFPGSCDRPENWSDLDAFVTALASRYKGRIAAYEIWNEPHNSNRWNETNNTKAQFVTLTQHVYDGIRAADPAALIVSPSGRADWMDSYYYSTPGAITKVSATETRGWDVISQHSYPAAGRPPEFVVGHTAAMKSVMANHGLTQPLWTTEGSWGGSNNEMDQQLKVAFVARFALLHWSSEVDRFYWYAWDNQGWGTLFDTTPPGAEVPAANAYRQVYDWMVGATMNAPCTSQGTVWTCDFTRTSPANYRAEAIWDTSQSCSPCTTLKVTVPTMYLQYRDLDGTTTAISGHSVPVGAKPILLENVSNLPLPPTNLEAVAR